MMEMSLTAGIKIPGQSRSIASTRRRFDTANFRSASLRLAAIVHE
jgi:hypothetical protein